MKRDHTPFLWATEELHFSGQYESSSQLSLSWRREIVIYINCCRHKLNPLKALLAEVKLIKKKLVKLLI